MTQRNVRLLLLAMLWLTLTVGAFGAVDCAQYTRAALESLHTRTENQKDTSERWKECEANCNPADLTREMTCRRQCWATRNAFVRDVEMQFHKDIENNRRDAAAAGCASNDDGFHFAPRAAEPAPPTQADQDFRITDGVGCAAHLAPSGRGIVLEPFWPGGGDLHYCWQESPDFTNASVRGSCTREGFRSTGPLAHGQRVTVLQDSPRPSTSDGFIKAGLVCYSCEPGDPKQTCHFGLYHKSSSQYNFLSAEQSAKLEGR